jgi:hypothetical protein
MVAHFPPPALLLLHIRGGLILLVYLFEVLNLGEYLLVLVEGIDFNDILLVQQII